LKNYNTAAFSPKLTNITWYKPPKIKIDNALLLSLSQDSKSFEQKHLFSSLMPRRL